MKKIFIVGSVTGTTEAQKQKFSIYEKVAQQFYPTAIIDTPQTIMNYRDRYITQNREASERQVLQAMVNYDMQEIMSSELILCDATLRSFGVGMELATAKRYHIPVIFFAEKGADVSKMILGAFEKSFVHFYENDEDLENILYQVLGETKSEKIS